jgi:DNA-binding transcriptional ArsR family regulator
MPSNRALAAMTPWSLIARDSKTCQRGSMSCSSRSGATSFPSRRAQATAVESSPTTTRHLGVLRDAGLVTIRESGRERIYRLERDRLRAVVGDWLAWFDTEPLAGSRR